MKALARTTDPETSHAAAASVGDLRLSQGYVLKVLQSFGACTDEELVDIYGHLPNVAPQSPSGLRSRRAELVRLGLVEFTGEKRPISTGRLARVWSVVD